jgi:AraC-like DNA-binding protein
MNTLFTIGIFLSFFLSLLLFSKKQKTLSDKILALWMGVIGIHLSSYYLYSLGYWSKYPHLVGVTHPVPLFHGPLLFLYTLYSLRDDKRLRKVDFLHFTPVFFSYLYMTRFYFFYSAEQKVLVDTGQIDDFALFSIFSLIAFLVSGILYPILSYRIIGAYKRLLDENYSYKKRISLDWLKYCIWGIGVIYLTAAVVSILREGLGIKFVFNADFIFYAMIIIFVFCIGYFGIRHQGLFSDLLGDESKLLVRAKPQKEYKKSGLKPEIAENAHQKLQQVMKEEKLFTNPTLTLSELAGRVEISPNHLSQIINQYEKKNFHDFVNKYRIDEFIQQALTNNNFSFLALALDAGFNSKSSFNSVFKKHKGVTPSKYKANIANHPT